MGKPTFGHAKAAERKHYERLIRPVPSPKKADFLRPLRLSVRMRSFAEKYNLLRESSHCAPNAHKALAAPLGTLRYETAAPPPEPLAELLGRTRCAYWVRSFNKH